MQGVFHMALWGSVICGEQFWEKVGYTLDDTMRGETHMVVRQFWMGNLTLEDTIEWQQYASVTTSF